MDKLACHFHDTFGMAILNYHIAYEEGIRSFDTSAGGLGGCPIAQSSSGNCATEDFIYFLKSMGQGEGFHLQEIVEASEKIFRFLNRTSPSSVHRALMKEKAK